MCNTTTPCFTVQDKADCVQGAPAGKFLLSIGEDGHAGTCAQGMGGHDSSRLVGRHVLGHDGAAACQQGSQDVNPTRPSQLLSIQL